jgi:RES domain-containing protein
MNTHRVTAKPLTVYRVGDIDGAYPVWSGAGAVLTTGRWHMLGEAVIYASEHYSLAMLEKLSHWNGLLPTGQHYVAATIPAGVSYEVFQPAAHIGWNARIETVAQQFGSKWIKDCRSAILFVPSVIAPLEQNVLVNPNHPDAAQIEVSLEQPVWWDDRLLSR